MAWKNGNPLRLKDVATIVDDAENLRLAAWADRTPGVLLNVQSQPLLWSLGASVTEAILDGGQRKLASAQARAAADQATAA